MAIRILQSFLIVYPCLKIPVFVRFPSVYVFLLSAARSSLLFNFFLWLWKLTLEKRKPMMMLVLSGGSSFPACFFSSSSFVCVLGTKAKLGTLAFCSFRFLACAFGPPSLGTLCFVLCSLSIYSLSILLFISLRLCSLRGNKNLLFWFVLRSSFSAVRGFFFFPSRDSLFSLAL